MAILLLADLLSWLAVPALPEVLSQLGLVMLLSAFAVLVGAGLAGGLKMSVRTIADYFSSTQKSRRRLLFAQARQDQVKRLFYFRTVQLKYFNALKRTRLLKANNRKHLHLLSNAISQQLTSVKTNLAAETFKELQQQHARYRRQQNVAALLQLQQQIANLTDNK
ncbi:MAG: hypothetical protein Q8N35_13810 [Methylococcaceae bacterium]|nr:hypothetical protein [Methylococcaceae bacterium]MDZ4155508.1 hypothetical protein [Methylococcales bacterium]MDP2395232.1 hypothetical protein [Methylococcaceae bacterium]MDP3020656.1 hypothetical protein [Methylococcaceae bacterium]MDP3390095.1 hypothetical protein [Methylococcaceae bacterium]